MGHLIIIRSDRGGEGKTLLAHLVVEYLVERRADWFLFATNRREAGIRGPDAERVDWIDIGKTREQVRFADMVLRDRDAWTILDLSHVDNAAFLAFCDDTGLVSELLEREVATWSLRVYSDSLRNVARTFWAESLVDAREVLVVNDLDTERLAQWRIDPVRSALSQERVPEMVLPRIDRGAVSAFLSKRVLLSTYLVDRSEAGVDVFARVQLAKLVATFQPQLAQIFLSVDLGRLDHPLFQ